MAGWSSGAAWGPCGELSRQGARMGILQQQTHAWEYLHMSVDTSVLLLVASQGRHFG
jgi:hypothetical protein